MIKEYSCGFMFWEGKVLLIEKRRPKWQAGKFNGVGGHIEKGETSTDAMVREFWEETGLITEPDDWHAFCVYHGPGYVVNFFAHHAEYDQVPAAESRTDEPVSWHDVDNLPTNRIPNLAWLVPLARDRCVSKVLVLEKGV